MRDRRQGPTNGACHTAIPREADNYSHITSTPFNGTALAVGGDWWPVIADPPLPQTSIPSAALTSIPPTLRVV